MIRLITDSISRALGLDEWTKERQIEANIQKDVFNPRHEAGYQPRSNVGQSRECGNNLLFLDKERYLIKSIIE